MRKSEINEIYRFLFEESFRLENLSIAKWNNIFIRRRYDALDILELLEIAVQIEYFNYIEQRIHKLLEYMEEIY